MQKSLKNKSKLQQIKSCSIELVPDLADDPDNACNGMRNFIIRQILTSIWFVLYVLTFLLAASAVHAAEDSLLPTQPVLSELFGVLEGNTAQHAEVSAIHYDFGQIKLLNAAPIEHTFVLQNEGKDAIMLDRLQPSCGCTSAVIGNGAVSPKGIAIAPGQRLSIHTSVDPQRLSPGPIDKFVSVFVQGQASPAVTLEITGTLEGGVIFSQSALDFRTIRAGSKAGLPLNVTLDVPLLPAGVKPHLVSSNPDVVLEEQPNLTGGAATAETLVQSYTVRLAPHPKLGILTGIISVVGGDPANLQLLSPTTVSIQGEVTGDVTASPSACAFGMVTQGSGQVQRLQLTAATRADLQKLKMTSSSRFLSLRLVTAPDQKATGSSSTARTLLEIRLDPKTPIGVLQAQITVKTPMGEQLVLPVYAYVVHAEHTQ